MISTDKEWKNLVRNIANGSANNRECVHEASGYLWDSYNWERLRETTHGKFLREVDNQAPDYGLRALYKKQVLESQE